MSQATFKHFHKVLKDLSTQVIHECADNGEPISCKKGCCYCCYLLVEIPWEEAEILTDWLIKQPPSKRTEIMKKIKRNAQDAKRLFRKNDKTAYLAEPVDQDAGDFPDQLCDDYFYEKSRPCPLLKDGCCSAYESRPTVCQLHVVSSPAKLCTRQAGESDEYHIPDTIEELKEKVTPIQQDLAKDGRWGHLAIMLEAVLQEKHNITL